MQPVNQQSYLNQSRKPIINDMDFLIQEPAEVYHAKAGQYLSSHQMIDFLKCPLLYHRKQTGQIEDQVTSSFMLGQAAHVRILEGQEVYEQQFAIGGPINPTTGKPYGSLTKKFAEWREKQQKPVLTVEQSELIEQMALGVAYNEVAVELISNGVAEGVVRTHYCGIPCQIRVDWLNPNQGIVDFKTCDDLTWFEADARRFRYHNQVTFYQSVLNAAIGVSVPVYLIAIEKKEPFRCGVWRVSDECLATTRHENEAAIERLLSCRTDNHWPTSYEEIRIFDIY